MPPNAVPKSNTSFNGRAGQLALPFLPGESGRPALIAAMVSGADQLSVARCTEASAAIAWHTAMVDDDAAWAALTAPMIKKLHGLFDIPINPAWPPDRALQVLRGALRALLPVAPPGAQQPPAPQQQAPPPPLPGAGGGGGGPLFQPGTGLNINQGRPPRHPAAAAQPPPPPGAGIGGAGGGGPGASAAAAIIIPSARRMLTTELLALLPRRPRNVLHLAQSWSAVKQAQQLKSGKTLGTMTLGDEANQDKENPTWAQRILLDLADSSEINLDWDGLNLMRMALWPLPSADRGQSLTQQYMNLRDQDAWIDARRTLSSQSGISSQALSDLQAIVQSSMAQRAANCVMDLGGRTGPLAEVILDIEQQSASLHLLFSAYAALARERFSGRSNSEWNANQMWLKLFTPFMERHVMNSFLGSGDSDGTSRKRSWTVMDGSAGGGAPGGPLGSTATTVLLPPPAYHTIMAPPPLPPPPVNYPQWTFPPIQQPAAMQAAPAPPPPLPPPPYVAPAGRIAPLGAGGPSAARRGAAGSKGFVGWPASADIIGGLSTYPAGTHQAFQCKACGGAHSMWECPIRYHSNLGAPCPGFHAGGAQDSAAWSGGELTAAARLAWIAYGALHRLVVARSAPPGVPAF